MDTGVHGGVTVNQEFQTRIRDPGVCEGKSRTGVSPDFSILQMETEAPHLDLGLFLESWQGIFSMTPAAGCLPTGAGCWLFSPGSAITGRAQGAVERQLRAQAELSEKPQYPRGTSASEGNKRP